jgi:hypothetical protein
MRIQYLPPKGEFETIRDDEHLKEKLKEWGLSAAKKEFFYKERNVQQTVSIKGYETYGKLGEINTVVVEFEDGNLSCIHPAFLKEMQSAGFGKDTSFLTDDKEQESAITEAVSNEAAEVLDTSIVQEDQSPVTAAPEPKKAKEPKPKKEKAPKIELPADKVHFTAMVKQFAMTYNHFTEENDEVVILENVQLVDQALDLGFAWCSHSKTLKKFELAPGDQLEFDGKVAAKKLAKGKEVEEEFMFDMAVPYKINNPSKITKTQ